MLKLVASRSLRGRQSMVDFSNPKAAAERLRAATESLNDPRDLLIVKEYLAELERRPWLKQDAGERP